MSEVNRMPSTNETCICLLKKTLEHVQMLSEDYQIQLNNCVYIRCVPNNCAQCNRHVPQTMQTIRCLLEISIFFQVTNMQSLDSSR